MHPHDETKKTRLSAQTIRPRWCSLLTLNAFVLLFSLAACDVTELDESTPTPLTCDGDDDDDGEGCDWNDEDEDGRFLEADEYEDQTEQDEGTAENSSGKHWYRDSELQVYVNKSGMNHTEFIQVVATLDRTKDVYGRARSPLFDELFGTDSIHRALENRIKSIADIKKLVASLSESTWAVNPTRGVVELGDLWFEESAIVRSMVLVHESMHHVSTGQVLHHTTLDPIPGVAECRYNTACVRDMRDPYVAEIVMAGEMARHCNIPGLERKQLNAMVVDRFMSVEMDPNLKQFLSQAIYGKGYMEFIAEQLATNNQLL